MASLLPAGQVLVGCPWEAPLQNKLLLTSSSGSRRPLIVVTTPRLLPCLIPGPPSPRRSRRLVGRGTGNGGGRRHCRPVAAEVPTLLDNLTLTLSRESAGRLKAHRWWRLMGRAPLRGHRLDGRSQKATTKPGERAGFLRLRQDGKHTVVGSASNFDSGFSN